MLEYERLLPCAEVKDDVFVGLRRAGSILPVLYGCNGILDQDGISAQSLNCGHRAIGQHDRMKPHLSLDMFHLQDQRIGWFYASDHFAREARLLREAKLRDSKGDQQNGSPNPLESPLR